MAFSSNGLTPIYLGGAGGLKRWHYVTTEALATVLASGYFNDASDLMVIGEEIDIYTVDAVAPAARTSLTRVATAYVAGNSSGTVTTDLVQTLGRIVTLTGDTSITKAAHDDKILLLGEVGGNAALAATLPAATGSGARFKFVVSVVNTSGYTIQVVGNDTMDGQILSLQDAADTVVGWETAATSDTITLNGTTTGGVSIGDWVELIDIATDQWAVTGITTSSGTEATPFSAAVS